MKAEPRMNPERWRRVDELLQLTLQRPPGEREQFLRQACGNDDALKNEIRSLLDAQAEAGSFLESPAVQVAVEALGFQSDAAASEDTSAPRESQTLALPSHLGRYRLLRRLGEGGMGAVYEAEQESPRRVVALKVIKYGFPTAELQRRFERESRALGRLHHPGIAQIYEAGTADTGLGPLPYFVMEFVRGQLLLDYVEGCHLDVRSKLELMLKICEAVHHAHQQGVIHRDLKPGNILVDPTGQPKILDFGLSRMTESDVYKTRQTDLGQLVGTLAYMSPEQVLADPMELDTRSDVYALGVILYELLAQRLPYTVGSKIHEAIQAIRETDPLPLGSINRYYRGDIETITAKALEKDKARRYGSAAELAADIRRYLADEPILARPASTTYQLQKFARRHKALVAGVAAVFVVLAAGIVASTWQAARATRERDRAAAAERNATIERDRALGAEKKASAAEAQALQERNRAIAEKQRADTEAATAKAVNDFLQNDLLAQASAATQSRPNSRPDPDLKVRTALDRAASQIAGKFEAQPLVEASIRHTIAGAYVDLGLILQAQQQQERVLELDRRSLGENNPETLSMMNDLAMLYQRQGRYAESESLEAKAIETRRRLLGEQDPRLLVEMGNLAFLYMNEGKFAQAAKLLTNVLKVQQGVNGETHPDTLFTMINMGMLYRSEGKYAQAEPIVAKVVQARTRMLGAEHPDTLASMSILAQVYQGESRYAEAESLFTKVLDVRRRVLGEQHFSTLVSMNFLADLYRTEGRDTQAEALYSQVLEGRRRVLGPEHPDTTRILAVLGQMRLEKGLYAEAEPLLREALIEQEKGSPGAWSRFDTESMLGAVLANQQKYGEAEPLLTSGYEGLVQRQATIPQASRAVVQRAGERIVHLYQNWGKPEEAAEWREKLLHPR
jgi:hypothetical protein